MKVNVLTCRKKGRKTAYVKILLVLFKQIYTREINSYRKNLLVSLFYSQRFEENKLTEGVYRFGAFL